jgi:hypothetical protein
MIKPNRLFPDRRIGMTDRRTHAEKRESIVYSFSNALLKSGVNRRQLAFWLAVKRWAPRVFVCAVILAAVLELTL